MPGPRFFIHGAAAHAADLRDRAAAHGAVVAVRAYAAPGPGVYGCTEVTLGRACERIGCACPRVDGTDCIRARSVPPWAEEEGDYVEEGERCECACHDEHDADLEDVA